MIFFLASQNCDKQTKIGPIPMSLAQRNKQIVSCSSNKFKAMLFPESVFIIAAIRILESYE